MSLILIVSWIIQELQRFFFEACAVAFGSLSWDAAHVELIMYRMNYPGVCMVQHCRDMDMGSSAWKMFKKRTERTVVSPQPVGLFERNKLVQGNDEVEPSMAYWSLNKPQNKIQLFSYYSSTFFFGGSVGCWRLNLTLCLTLMSTAVPPSYLISTLPLNLQSIIYPFMLLSDSELLEIRKLPYFSWCS